MGGRYAPGFNKNVGSFIPDELVAGDFDVVTDSVTLKAGSVYVRGTVLMALAGADADKFGIVTDDTKAKYILLEDIDATAGDHVGTVAVTGQYNTNALVIGAGATMAGIKKALEPLSIYLSTGFAGGVADV